MGNLIPFGSVSRLESSNDSFDEDVISSSNFARNHDIESNYREKRDRLEELKKKYSDEFETDYFKNLERQENELRNQGIYEHESGREMGIYCKNSFDISRLDEKIEELESILLRKQKKLTEEKIDQIKTSSVNKEGFLQQKQEIQEVIEKAVIPLQQMINKDPTYSKRSTDFTSSTNDSGSMFNYDSLRKFWNRSGGSRRQKNKNKNKNRTLKKKMMV